MCAMMPMFRVRLSGVSLGIEFSFQLQAVSFPLRSYPSFRSFNPAQQSLTFSAGRWEVKTGSCLPAIVRERFVRFRHPVRIFALLHRAAAQVRRVEQLVGQLLLHRLAVSARPREADEPADA